MDGSHGQEDMAGTHKAQWDGTYASDLEDRPKASGNGGCREDAARSIHVTYCCTGDTSNVLNNKRVSQGIPGSVQILVLLFDSFMLLLPN